jgi:lysylphosphatidylglycerol synthetase-like protein (DUF2156 family)
MIGSGAKTADPGKTPVGIWLLVGFFVLATTICAASALSLAVPGTALDHVWGLKPAARSDFASLGSAAALFLSAIGAAMAFAAAGLWKRTSWGWWTAVCIFAVNMTADAVHSIAAREPSGALGVAIDALLLWYLCQPGIRRRFGLKALGTQV